MSYRSIHAMMHSANEVTHAITLIHSAREVPSKYRKYLLKYYHLHVPFITFKGMLTDEDKIIHQGVVYLVARNYQPSSVSVTDVMELSFRQTKHQLGIDNYVIVSVKE